MTVYISEHSGRVGQERWSVGPPLGAPYSLSTTGPSTPALPNARTDYIRVTADQRSFLAFTVSTVSTAIVLTSTMSNVFVIPANAAAERIPVPAGASSTGGSYRIMAASTTT